MKKLIILIIIPVLFGFKTGQDIDEKKMNRDLEIAKNILATLIKTGSHSFFGGTSIEANYIKDFGVIFTIPEHLVYFHTGQRDIIEIPDLPPLPDFNVIVDVIIEKDIEEFEEEVKGQLKKEKQKDKESTRRAEREIKKIRRETRIVLADAENLNKIYFNSGKTSDIDWEEIMVTFLTDYASLIGQLQPNEKIIINQKSPYDELVFIWSGSGTAESDNSDKAGLSVEVLYKDVKANKLGKINRAELVKRITIKRNEPQKKVADLEMFASIFDRFYSRDLSETFYCESKPRYEVLEGFGVVFHINASSTIGQSSRVHFYNPGNAWRMETDTDESIDADLYPKFKEDIKAFMLDYGRTIRSLKDEDKVLLDINISACRDCQIPKSIEVSTEISLLKKYDQQKISREKALEEITIKENY